MDRIKVLRIIARLNVGGPAIHTILLTEGLNADRYESLLISGHVEPDEGDMSYLAEKKGINPVFINELGREISWADDLIAFFKIYRLLRKYRPNIVHTHTAKAGAIGRVNVIIYNCIVLLQSKIARIKNKLYRNPPQVKLKGIKLVHTFHGHVFDGYFGSIKSTLFVLIERALSHFTDRVIAISLEQEKDLCRNYRIVPKKKVSIVPLGLELKKFFSHHNNKREFRQMWNVPDETALIGIVGRLVPIKNHNMLLRSIKELKNKPVSSNYKLVIIGDGELREELSNYVQEIGIEENVIFAGWQRDIEVVYQALDLVVLTSLNEGTPVSLIEAMASGKPVLSTNVGGVIDLMGNFRNKIGRRSLDEFDNGILVKSGDIEGFTEALRILINDKELRDSMGAKGREYVKERYDVSRLVKDMETIYESL